MTDMFEAEAPAAIGDNKPESFPTPGIEELSEYLNLTYAEIVDRANAIVAKAPEFFEIANDAEDAAATEFMVKVRKCWKWAEEARTKEKTPWDDLAGVAHAHFKNAVLDPLGLDPTDKRGFDPKTRTDLGVGPRVNQAQTIYKTAKADAERKKREEEARLAREAEQVAARKRQEEERLAREAEDKRRREAEAAEAKAREEARQAVLAASRKRSDETRAAAEAEAKERRRLADEATAKRLEEQRKADEEREIRERANREAENKLAEERAAAEQAAAASAADMTRNRGEKGGVSSLREHVDFRDLDRDTLDLNALRPYFKDAHLEQAIRGYADANRATVAAHLKAGTQPVKGVVFFIGYKNAGRA